MGCTSSKLDDLPAVALCRDRCTLLDEAIQTRYKLAEAHISYLQSLKQIGISFHNFFHQKDVEFPPSSPILTLPNVEKKNDLVKSNSGSHINFHSDSNSGSDDELCNVESLHYNHSGNFPGSPLHIHNGSSNSNDNVVEYYVRQDGTSSFPCGYMHSNYMKKQIMPSVLYEHKPMSVGTVHMSESSYFPHSYYNIDDPGSFSYPYFGEYSNYGGGINSSDFSDAGVSYQAAGSSSKQPPPPPSPPRGSAWDFLNPFKTYDKLYSPHATTASSQNSKDIREEEGIPDLEDEDDQQEAVEEVHGNQNYVNDRGSEADNEHGNINARDAFYQTMPRVSAENEDMEYEVHVVDKKVVESEEKTEGNVGAFKGGSCGVSEVVREIQVQFERASESGSEIAKFLEVGKLLFQQKPGAYQVSSKMLHAITPSLSAVSSQPSISTFAESSLPVEKDGSGLLRFDEDVDTRIKSLSSTLEKLYLWEKKLYNEVKAEEKMRVVYDRKCLKLKRLDEKGAEAFKVDSTRTLVKSLSTKIRMAIQVVDKISVTINKIRDDELWPQTNELLRGLTGMWKSMMECHHSQFQAIRELRNLNFITSHNRPATSNIEATLQLEHELINWILRFSTWVGALKGYVRALNNWLMKCLLYEPEETPDGVAPFSPSRIGAPLVFVICNQWAQALERISEREVVNCMRVFSITVLQFWERDKLILQQTVVADRDLERKARELDKEDHKIQKEIQALDRRMLMTLGDESSLALSENIVYQIDASNANGLQASMQNFFEAMERFTADSMKAYEELLQYSEDYRLSHENSRGS